MAPTNPGGRPRNEWTPSRRRKLVRLYTLTNLDKEEIQVVLKDGGFSPRYVQLYIFHISIRQKLSIASTSDVQKKLRQLLPRDYAKDWRKFRPVNESNMRSRLSCLRSCREGRIRKSRHRRTARASRRSCSTEVQTPSSIIRNEGTDPTPSCHTSHIPLPPASQAISHQDTIDPALLSQSRFSDHDAISSETFHESETQAFPNPLEASSTPLIDSEYTNDSRPASQALAKASSSVDNKQSSKDHTLLSLRSRLTSQHTRSYLEHVCSTLRYSSTNSWRSSIISLSSLASSRRSIRSLERDTATAISDRSSVKDRGSAQDMVNNHQLSKAEQKIWDELVDESCLLFEAQGDKSTLVPEASCCDGYHHRYEPNHSSNRADSVLCQNCGFRAVHQAAKYLVKTSGPAYWKSLEGARDGEDYYGNTALHFLASTGKATSSMVSELVNSGVNIFARNSFGKTFMHVFKARGFDADLYNILLFLKGRDFRLDQRDHRGRTLAHSLFASYVGSIYSIDCLPAILLLLEPSCAAYDSTGKTVQDAHREWVERCQEPGTDISYNDFLVKVIASTPADLRHSSFRERLREEGLTDGGRNLDHWSQYATQSGLRYIANEQFVSWVDKDGDTLLLALLKEWPSGGDELILPKMVKQLLHTNTEVDMRDRMGRTALAVAARRGFRAVVKMLLSAGANFHTRDANGKGIIINLGKALREAEAGESEERYARILSCINLLVDAGAIIRPSKRDERLSARVRSFNVWI
jgi:hypothetical protein